MVTTEVLKKQLQQPIGLVDLSDRMQERLTEGGLNTIGDILSITQDQLIERIKYVGPVRSRLISNAAKAAVLEYLAG